MATVLIIDDHPAFLSAARRLLTAEGFDVIREAAGVLSGIAAAQQLRPEVVLLDIQLPTSTGSRSRGASWRSNLPPRSS